MGEISTDWEKTLDLRSCQKYLAREDARARASRTGKRSCKIVRGLQLVQDIGPTSPVFNGEQLRDQPGTSRSIWTHEVDICS